MIDTTQATLSAAREALARHDWQGAYETLLPHGRGCDDLDVIETFAEAAWWTSRLDECIEAREHLYRRCELAADNRRAAQVAMLLYDNHCFKGRRAVANGWLSRAKRLLADAVPCIEQGNLLLREAEVAHAAGSLEDAAVHARAALGLGRELRSDDLEAESLQCLGRILIVDGRVDDGFALYDEAMLAAVEGRLSPFVAGKVYCSLISACEEVGDLRRAAEWSEVGFAWAASHPVSAFPGLCRVHRAEVLQLRGEWARAEDEARRACDELQGVNVFNMALGFREVGEIRRRLGDVDGAEAAFARASDLGLQPQPGLALLRLDQGKVAVAMRMINQALCEERWNRLGRAKLLPASTRIAIAAGDFEFARAAADELAKIAADYRSDGLVASAATARGLVELAEGDSFAAASTLRRALHRWQDLQMPYEAAVARTHLSVACRNTGDDEGACTNAALAAEAFRALGAPADLAGTRPPPPQTALPDGLTEREVEVLRLVASGAGNRAIAQQLVLSEKTVARHVSNIFRKTGLSSRSAATAYAFERGICGPAR